MNNFSVFKSFSKKYAIILLGFFTVPGLTYGQGAELNPPVNLKVEYLANPSGVDVLQPRFSWLIDDHTRGARQTAYQIVVSKDSAEIKNNTGSGWNTGKVLSGETANIRYKGDALESNETYYWRVRIWNKNGKPGPWSSIHFFHTALLNPADWQAQWITTPDSTVTSPLFRDEFTVKKEIELAYAFVTGVGYYEFYLNGKKVGDHVLDPAITNYHKRILYETYDVTGQLQQGANAWGLWLGNGGYRIKREEDRWTWYGLNNYFGTPAGLVQLHIRYRDGSKEIICSDASWKTDASPVTYNNVYGGEDYDARLEQKGWTQAGFDDRKWNKVQIAEKGDIKLDSQVMPPIRVTRTLEPVRSIHPEPGRYLFDLGQNIPGWWQLRVEGARGIELKIRGAETLNDSLFPTPLKPGDRLSTNRLYHEKVWATYTLRGGEVETWEPRFFYTGFRYIEVNVSEPEQLHSLDVTGRLVHSDIPRNGHFSSSDSLLNDMYEAAIWSQRGNLHGYPTDCPHREKGGYNGDGQVVAEASMHDFHMHPFYVKWLEDMRDTQYENGRIPNTSPTILGGTGGGIGWGSAYVLIPWWMHNYYDDRNILKDHYDSMKKYMGYLHHLARNDSIPQEQYIINEFGGHWDSIGEWEAPDIRNGPNNPLTNTYYWYLDTITMAKIAEVLEKPADQRSYLALADTIKSAFNDKFFDPQTNLYGPNPPFQSYLFFALAQDLVPEERRKAVLDNLIHDIMVTRDGHLGTGILGTKHMFDVLMNEKQQEVLHTIVTKKTFPGWGHWIVNGATTLWEAWDASGSHNHQMFGSINEYFYKYLAGIRAPTDHGTSPGYRQILIAPYVPENLDHAEAAVQTIRGEVSSSWRKQGQNQISLQVTLPPNTTGTVQIPDLGLEKITVTEGSIKVWKEGQFLKEAEGVSGARRGDGYVAFDLTSGRYIFNLSAGN